MENIAVFKYSKQTEFNYPFYMSVYSVLYDLMCDNELFDSNKIFVYSNHPDYRQRASVLVDTLTLNGHELHSSLKNITFDLTDKHHVANIFNVFNEYFTEHTHILQECIIAKAKVRATAKNKTNQKLPSKKTPSIQIRRVYDEESPSDVLNELEQLTNKLKQNSEPTIEKIMFPEELKNEDANNLDELDDHQRRKKELRERSAHVPKNVQKNVIDEELKKFNDEIKALEEKQKIDEENLSKLHCITADEKYKIKKDEDRQLQKFNVFLSEKNYTYQQLLTQFFDPESDRNWDSLPPFFVVKFAVFLFMDGKDINGESVRERILDTADEYQIFTVLYNTLTDDEFINDNQEYEKIIEDFTNSLPPIKLVSEDDVQNFLNEQNKQMTEMFERDMTTPCSVDENIDGNFSNYGLVPGSKDEE